MAEKKYVIDNPALMAEWDWKKNDELGFNPKTLTLGSGKKVWWKCSKEHEWQATIDHRNNGRGCPLCSRIITTQKRINKFILEKGSLFSNNEDLMIEWNYQENTKKGLNPHELTSSSNHKASWICCKCGYMYEAVISNRTKQKSGCPLCANKIVIAGKNDIESSEKSLMEEWDWEENLKRNLHPHKFSRGSEVKVHWKCKYCGAKWIASIYSRVNGSGCPDCAKETRTSIPEQALFFYLKSIFPDAINAYQPQWLYPSEIDIYLPSISFGVEYDGEGFHCNKEKDKQKDSICQKQGISILHIREPKCPQMPAESIIYLRKDKKYTSIDEMVYGVVEIIKKYTKIEIDICPNFETDRMYILEQYFTRVKANSLSLHKNVCINWDSEKNKGLSPEKISKGSNLKVYWKCPTCGYQWQARVADEVSRQRGCIKCNRKNHANSKALLQCNVNGKVIKEFPSLKIAANECHLCYSSLSVALKTGRVYCGYIWKYKRDHNGKQ